MPPNLEKEVKSKHQQKILKAVLITAPERRVKKNMKAVVDRFEGDYAILLFGEKEIKVDFPKELLPKEVKVGNWLKITLTIDEKETAQQEKKISKLLDKLQKKNG